MAAVSAAASAPAKKVDWSTYEYTPCCDQFGFVPHKPEGKIHCTCMQLLFPTDRPLCTVHNGFGVFDQQWSEGKPFSKDEITVRLTRVKQLIPQLEPKAAYTAVQYRRAMISPRVSLISQVVLCVDDLPTLHELLALLFTGVWTNFLAQPFSV